MIGAGREANSRATYVLPLYLTSEKDSVNADKSELFIRIADVLTPTVGFTNTDIQPLSYTYGFDTQSVEIGFGLDTDNNWEVECRFAVDPEYLSSYNGKHGTAYRLLPEGNYSFEEINLLPAGTTTTDLAVSLSGSGLAPGEYMLPVRLDKFRCLMSLRTQSIRWSFGSLGSNWIVRVGVYKPIRKSGPERV